MRKAKSYTWLKPETKKFLKKKAMDLDKDLLDLEPEDLGFEKNKKRFTF